MVLGDAEETITSTEVDEETGEELVTVGRRLLALLCDTRARNVALFLTCFVVVGFL